MRVRELAQQLDLPPRQLLQTLQQHFSYIPATTIMFQLASQEVDNLLIHLASQGHSLPAQFQHLSQASPTQGMAEHVHLAARRAQNHREEQERQWELARQRRIKKKEEETRKAQDLARDMDLRKDPIAYARLREAQRAERRAKDHVAAMDTLSKAKRLLEGFALTEHIPLKAPSPAVLLETQGVKIEHAPLPRDFARAMARRRAAVRVLAERHTSLVYGYLFDVALVRADPLTHQRLLAADYATLDVLRRCVPSVFPFELDWEYVARYGAGRGAPIIRPGLLPCQIFAPPSLHQELEEQLSGYLSFEAFESEEWERLTRLLQSPASALDVDALYALTEDADLVMSSLLPAEFARASPVIRDAIAAHVLGQGTHATQIQLFEDDENTRYVFLLCVGEGGIALAVRAYDL